MEKKIYLCKTCGISLHNRADWCYLGCGNDYNEMVEVKGSTEFINEIRLDTLRQVLPEDYKKCIKDLQYKCEWEGGEANTLADIVNKAKEIWGISLN